MKYPKKIRNLEKNSVKRLLENIHLATNKIGHNDLIHSSCVKLHEKIQACVDSFLETENKTVAVFPDWISEKETFQNMIIKVLAPNNTTGLKRYKDDSYFSGYITFPLEINETYYGNICIYNFKNKIEVYSEISYKKIETKQAQNFNLNFNLYLIENLK